MLDKEVKNVIKNASYLLVTQGLTYLAPILVLGYLIKTLGVDGFGKYALSLTVAAYLQVIVDYGFSFSASRKISQNRLRKDVVSRVYWSTILIKLCICCVMYPVFYFFLVHIVEDSQLFSAINLGYLAVVGNAIFPIWFYQGIEKLKIIAILNAFSRIISCLLVFLLVKKSEDTGMAVLIQSIPIILGGCIANLNIFKLNYVSWVRPNIEILRKSLKEGWDIFLATFASAILSNSSVLILGAMTTPNVVGAYAAVERIIKAVVSLFAPITQSIYPYNCNKFSSSINAGVESVKKTGGAVIILAMICVCGLFLSARFLLTFFDLPMENMLIVYILSIWLLLGVVNNVLGIQLLSAAGHTKSYSRCFIFASCCTVTIMYFLIKSLDGVGAAIALTLGECILFLALIKNAHRVFFKQSESN